MLSSLREWKQNSSGSIAVIFALAVLPATMATGIAVDYTHAVGAKARLQAATDALARATVREKALGTFTGTSASASNTSSGANPRLESYFTSNFLQSGYQDYNWWSWSGTTDSTTGKYTVTSRAGIKTAFMSAIGITEMTSQTTSTVNNNTGSPIEVVLVMDFGYTISSSEASAIRGAISDMASTFSSQYGATNGRLTMSLVPYGDWLYLGPDYNNSSANSWWINYNGYSSYYFNGVVSSRGSSGSSSYLTTNSLPVSGTTSSKYIMPTDSDYSTTYGRVTGLTNDFSLIQSRASGFYETGWDTDMPNAMLWGWNMLTPGLPPSNAAPYTSDMKKYLVFMAGGPVVDQADWWSSSVSTQTSRFNTLCTNIKNDNTTIYTIRFNSSSSSLATMLNNCATGSYMNVSSNSGLTTTLNSIASTIISENP